MISPATINLKPKIAAGVLMTLAFIGCEIPAVVGQAQPNKSVKSPSVNDGIYLYGETPQPNQASKGYVVFQSQKGKVVGAFYYPRSEFNCFTGSLKNNKLSGKGVGTVQTRVGAVNIKLSDLHQIKTVSANEHRMLSVCKQEIVAANNL